MSQQIVVTIRVTPDRHDEDGFNLVKIYYKDVHDCPFGEVTDVAVDVDDGAPKG